MGKVYFIADTHFGSDTIIRYENRPFQSITEMEAVLKENWNKTVHDEDTVYLLGDFSENLSQEEDGRIIKSLKGRKILIMGNHDTHRTPAQWQELGFDECSSLPVIYNGFFILSHEPLYINRNMPYANIYGHVHGNESYRTVSGQSACVSAERINYTPVLFEELFDAMKKEQKNQL